MPQKRTHACGLSSHVTILILERDLEYRNHTALDFRTPRSITVICPLPPERKIGPREHYPISLTHFRQRRDSRSHCEPALGRECESGFSLPFSHTGRKVSIIPSILHSSATELPKVYLSRPMPVSATLPLAAREILGHCYILIGPMQRPITQSLYIRIVRDRPRVLATSPKFTTLAYLPRIRPTQCLAVLG